MKVACLRRLPTDTLESSRSPVGSRSGKGRPSQPVSMFVRVFATAELVGYDGDWLHDDKMRGFAFEEIVVTETHLECWRPPNPPSSQAKAF